MKGISIKLDLYSQLDKAKPTIDLTAFHRFDRDCSMTNIHSQRFNLTCKHRHDCSAFHRLDYQDCSCTGTNLALLQWRVVDVAAQCNLITIAGRTRQTSSDKSATASNA